MQNLSEISRCVPGTRRLATSRLLGASFHLPKLGNWVIVGAYLPEYQNRGFRYRIQDDLGFYSFMDQLELEVIFGMGEPGQIPAWGVEEYPEYEDTRWVGPMMGKMDLDDDLFEYELELRCQYENIPAGTAIERPVLTQLLRRSVYYEVLLQNIMAQQAPQDVTTIRQRWSRAEEKDVRMG